MRKWVVAYNTRGNGLGNRLRMTLAARNLATARNREFAVVWPTGSRFRPRFSDLWEGDLGHPLPLILAQLLGRFYPFRDGHIRNIDSDADSRLWLIRTGGGLELPDGVRDWEDELRELVPIAAIADRIEKLHAQFHGAAYLGVQIRSHPVSHSQTKTLSPVEWFEHRLAEIHETDPTLRFFFSCDEEEVKSQFLDLSPGSVALDEKGPYNSVRGVQDAIVDLYLLASSGYIIGPSHSSFVELAVYLSDHTVYLETSMKVAQLHVDSLETVPDPLRPSRRG